MARLVWNERALDQLLRGPQGPVARDLARRAINVEGRAKLNASGRPGPNIRGGILRSSITWEIGVDSQGLYVRIGSNVVYAKVVEEGSPARQIRPVRKQALSWPGAPHPVRLVNHPGTKARPYLRPALAAAAT